MMQIKESFRKYLEEAIGCDKALVAFSAFEEPAKVSVRINPFKKGRGFSGKSILWNQYGRILEERPKFTLDPHFHGGAYYVQDSSSMFVGHVFRRLMDRIRCSASGTIRVLDLCAAPGGKTTDLAASLRDVFGDGFILVSNEVMKQRAGILADNVALWGDPNVVVTSDDPRAFASLPGFFDVVVTDVPCSGEGMFRKDEEAQEQWSEDNVALCQARQKRIIADMWPCLKPGGILIYSTCTFNRLENDDNVEWIAKELGAEVLKPITEDIPGVISTDDGYSLVPGPVEGEGEYCAALVSRIICFCSSETREAGKKACRADTGTDKVYVYSAGRSKTEGGYGSCSPVTHFSGCCSAGICAACTFCRMCRRCVERPDLGSGRRYGLVHNLRSGDLSYCRC